MEVLFTIRLLLPIVFPIVPPVVEVLILLAESVVEQVYVQVAMEKEVSLEIQATIPDQIHSHGLTVLPAMEIRGVSIVMVQESNKVIKNVEL